MSKGKSRNSLLFSSSRATQSASDKDELMAMRFLMNKPSLPVYPLSVGIDEKPDPTAKGCYPDFKPWRESTPTDPGSFNDAEALKENNASYLNKGYYEAPAVANEYSSARSLVQGSLFASSELADRILDDFSRILTGAFLARNESVNKIRYEGHQFKIPPRVTLTALKKEAWLRELADPEVPLERISGKLPHGIRNKILVESICNKNVPLPRAIWFTKCIVYSEIQALKKKYQAKLAAAKSTSTVANFELHWLHEWTQQVADYVHKFAREMSTITLTERKAAFMTKLAYLLRYLQALYLECLVDRRLFLSCIISILKEGLPLEPRQISALTSQSWDDTDVKLDFLEGIEKFYGQRFVALLFVRSFWNVITPLDYLCKELSEALLLNYYFFRRATTYNPKQSSHKQNADSLPATIKLKVLDMLGQAVVYLFKENSNTFILPSYWALIGSELSTILLDERLPRDDNETQLLHDQLKTIKYRNESLILNSKLGKGPDSTQSGEKDFKDQDAHDHWPINRSQNDLLRVIDSLDRYSLDESLAGLLRPSKDSTRWRIYLKLVIHWCITSHRDSAVSRQGILVVCNFIRARVLFRRTDARAKAEFESEVLEIIYDVVARPTRYQLYNLHVLINELYQLKIITISSYIRRLIALGVFYNVPEDTSATTTEIHTHLSILKNLPVGNNKQGDSILKKWVPGEFNFKTRFDTGKHLLETTIIENVLESKKNQLSHASSNDYFALLEVGVKFSLINWLTTQLKNTIASSTKLIHIYPSTIGILYDLFCACDNLTVFFTGIIMLILRNDGGTIIFYLDSLYLIAKLVVRHFRLIKYTATSPSEPPTVLELVKLIVLNYKDLQSRDFDYTDFRNIWAFLASLIHAEDYVTPVSEKSMHRSKNSAVSLTSTEVLFEWSHPAKSAPLVEDLKTVIDDLIAEPIALLSAQDHTEFTRAFDMDMDPSAGSDKLQLLLAKFEATLGQLDYDEEVSLVRLIVHHDRLLRAASGSADLLAQLKVQIGHISDPLRSTLFLKKLLCYELIQFLQIVDLLANDNEGFAVESDQLTSMQILFGNIRSGLFPHQQVMLNVSRQFYLAKNSVKVLPLILKSFKINPHLPEDHYKLFRYNMLEVLRTCCLFHLRTVIDEFARQLTNSEIIRLCNELAGVPSGSFISMINDIPALGKIADEFSLQVCQILLKTITQNELEYLGTHEAFKQIDVITEGLLGSFHTEFLPDNSYFGEIIDYCGHGYKNMFIQNLEKKFLKGTRFDHNSLSLRTAHDENLFPILKDFFKKISVSLRRDTSVTEDLFEALSNFLQQLLPLVELSSINAATRVDLQNAIGVFLRIIIIHKLPLVTTIIAKDSEKLVFVRGLIGLLKSSFLSAQNESLRILLYDLLFLMKSALTLELTMRANSMMEASPSTTQDEFSHQETQADTPVPLLEHGKQLFVNGSLASLTQVLTLPEPAVGNPFEAYKLKNAMDCSVMLDEEEVNSGSDYAVFNDSGLVGVPVNKSDEAHSQPFKIKSFEIIENTGTPGELNDGCVNLLLFGAYVVRENPT